MNIRVKLFGTFRQLLPEYDAQQGIEIDIHDGMTVSELLEHLGILKTGGAIVEMDGRILKADSRLQKDRVVKLFNVMSGG